MNGKIRYNLLAGSAGFILTFLFSIRNNLWTTSLNRALLAFVIWFLLSWLLVWVFSQAAAPAANRTDEADGGHDGSVGSRLDLVTPDQDDEELMELIKQEPTGRQEESGFTPLKPPKLVSTKDPEELAKAVRHLTEK